ncbi:MAG TPA: hypothetical protein VGG39_19690 [Polyangiaceae bacterium]|jgi:hypothetical protein
MTRYQDLGTFLGERLNAHRAYVADCIKLAEEVSAGFSSYLGVAGKVTPERMSASEGQKAICANGVFQFDKAVAVFAYTLELTAPGAPPHPVVLLMTVGKKGGEWFIRNEGKPFPLPRGGDPNGLEPAFEQLVRSVENEVRRSLPIEGTE